MRQYLLLIFVLTFCLTSAAEARKLALLVGVDDYANIESLRCCVNDINTLKEALIKIGFEESNIQILVTGGAFRNFPVKQNIEKKFSGVLSSVQPGDMVFIAFSGHGAQVGSKVYFCPADTDMDNLEGTCISITKVMDELAQCKARFKWVIIDACRNAPISSRDAKGLQMVPAPPASTGIALFQSCAEGEKSCEQRDGRNGYFMKNFAAALSGEADSNHDGRLALMEVCKWTTDHTKADVMKAEKKVQRPYLSGSVTDFILKKDLNVPKANALAEEAQKAAKKKNYELAIKKYKEAITLYPNNDSWKRELESLQLLLKKKPTQLKNVRVPDDFATIAEAYNHAADDGIITIQPGKYKLSQTLVVNRTVTFKGNAFQAKDVTIVCSSSDAFQIASGSPSFQDIAVVSEANDCNSFYITGGSPKILRCTIASLNGSGIKVNGEKCNPLVESCTIKDCGYFGALFAEKSQGLFKDCDICSNNGVGIMVAKSANPTFTRCKIYDGKLHGVGVGENGLGSFNDCDIYGNTFAGIAVQTSGNPTVTGCKIHDGKMHGITVSDKNSLGSFIDCEIYSNNNVGIVVLESGNPTFANCKIYDAKQVGVCVYDNGLGTFKNCDIYRNEKAGIEVKASGNPTVTMCRIHNGKPCGILVHSNGLGKFVDCEIYQNELGIAVYSSGNPTVTGCSIHNGNKAGIYVYNKGKGTFNNNTLNDNYWNGSLNNWVINPDAGKVKGSGNAPPMPANQ